MLYRIKPEKLEQLKEGKTNIYLEKITGYSRQYLSDIFTGKRMIKRDAVEDIVKPICCESVKMKAKLEKEGMDKFIKYFFEEFE